MRENAGISPSTIRSDFGALRSAVRYGGELLGAEDATATAMVKMDSTYRFLKHARRVAPSNERSRRPSDDELDRLQWHFQGRLNAKCPMWDVTLLAAATAMRRGEIVGVGGVTWGDVDHHKRMLMIRERKHPDGVKANDDLIPLLNGPMVWRGEVVNPLAIIERQATSRPAAGRIFPYAENSITNSFARACKDLDIINLHFHDLRHEGISRMFEYGMQIQQVAMVSGHHDWSSLKRYTQLKSEDLHSLMVTAK